jgi:iron-sulfur cluster repair protein YtfE (RIC family)
MPTRQSIDPIARFLQEHDHALQELSSLGKAVRSIEEKGWTPEADVRIDRALAFIRDEVGIHNKREEEALFPVLERYVEGPTRVMRDDHVVLGKEFRRLRLAVARMRKSKGSPTSAQECTETAHRVIQIFVNHIHKENHILFPLVRKFLTKDAMREVARRMV